MSGVARLVIPAVSIVGVAAAVFLAVVVVRTGEWEVLGTVPDKASEGVPEREVPLDTVATGRSKQERLAPQAFDEEWRPIPPDLGSPHVDWAWEGTPAFSTLAEAVGPEYANSYIEWMASMGLDPEAPLEEIRRTLHDAPTVETIEFGSGGTMEFNEFELNAFGGPEKLAELQKLADRAREHPEELQPTTRARSESRPSEAEASD